MTQLSVSEVAADSAVRACEIVKQLGSLTDDETFLGVYKEHAPNVTCVKTEEDILVPEIKTFDAAVLSLCHEAKLAKEFPPEMSAFVLSVNEIIRAAYSAMSKLYSGGQEAQECTCGAGLNNAATTPEEDRVSSMKSWSGLTATITKALEPNEELQIVYAVVLEPNDGGIIDGEKMAELRPDKQNDIYSAADIRKSAHEYAVYSRSLGEQHIRESNKKSAVVETFLAPVDYVAESGHKVVKGTWIVGTKVFDSVLWDDIKSGRYTGMSMEGAAFRTPEE